MMQRPYTLTELPNNLIAGHASVLTADVHALVGSRKRKRSELAVALDSESVNLYDVCCNTHPETQYSDEEIRSRRIDG